MNELFSANANSAFVYSAGAVAATAVAGTTIVVCKIIGTIRDIVCAKRDVAIAEADAKAAPSQEITNNYGATITVDGESEEEE